MSNTQAAAAKPVNNNGKETPTTPVVKPFEGLEPTKKASLPPIEKRLEKFQALEKILERREQIADALENLENFYIAPTGTGSNLKLQDSRGNVFAITHPFVIGEMVNLAKKRLSNELEEIDNLFDFSI